MYRAYPRFIGYETQTSAFHAVKKFEQTSQDVYFMNTFTAGGVTLSGDFDGGSLWYASSAGDGQVHVWPRPDCVGTVGRTNYRSWFYFTVRGASKGQCIQFSVRYINKQSNLAKYGHKVSFKAVPSNPEWQQVAAPLAYMGDQEAYECLPDELKVQTKDFELLHSRSSLVGGESATRTKIDSVESPQRSVSGRFQFTHTFSSGGDVVHFALCFPFSYGDQQLDLSVLEGALGNDAVSPSAWEVA